MDEWDRETQSHGALTPPPRVPPVAVATSAPLPPRPIRSTIRRRFDFGAFVNGALNYLDSIGDEIAVAVGLR